MIAALRVADGSQKAAVSISFRIGRCRANVLSLNGSPAAIRPAMCFVEEKFQKSGSVMLHHQIKKKKKIAAIARTNNL